MGGVARYLNMRLSFLLPQSLVGLRTGGGAGSFAEDEHLPHGCITLPRVISQRDHCQLGSVVHFQHRVEFNRLPSLGWE